MNAKLVENPFTEFSSNHFFVHSDDINQKKKFLLFKNILQELDSLDKSELLFSKAGCFWLGKYIFCKHAIGKELLLYLTGEYVVENNALKRLEDLYNQKLMQIQCLETNINQYSISNEQINILFCRIKLIYFDLISTREILEKFYEKIKTIDKIYCILNNLQFNISPSKRVLKFNNSDLKRSKNRSRVKHENKIVQTNLFEKIQHYICLYKPMTKPFYAKMIENRRFTIEQYHNMELLAWQMKIKEFSEELNNEIQISKKLIYSFKSIVNFNKNEEVNFILRLDKFINQANKLKLKIQATEISLKNMMKCFEYMQDAEKLFVKIHSLNNRIEYEIFNNEANLIILRIIKLSSYLENIPESDVKNNLLHRLKALQVKVDYLKYLAWFQDSMKRMSKEISSFNWTFADIYKKILKL